MPVVARRTAAICVEVEGFGPGQLVGLAVMAVRFEQHLGRGRGDVSGIDEGAGSVTPRQPERTVAAGP